MVLLSRLFFFPGVNYYANRLFLCAKTKRPFLSNGKVVAPRCKKLLNRVVLIGSRRVLVFPIEEGVEVYNRE